MKRFYVLIVVFVIFIISCKNLNDSKEGSNTDILFTNQKYDFKEIEKAVEHKFEFENIGQNDLLISNVKTSCGCTASKWSKEKIKPGKKGEIKLSFDAKHLGSFRKTATVFYNGGNSPKLLVIKGRVMNSKE